MNLPLPTARLHRLENYYHLLVQWNGKLNLIAPKQLASFDYFNQHHLAPCWWLADAIHSDGHKKGPNKNHDKNPAFIDLGSGNGLPAIPLGFYFGQNFTMVEKVNKKATALQSMVTELDLTANVVARTMEEVLPKIIKQQRPRFITARALLPLPKLLPLLSPIVPSGLPLYLLKGAKIHDEWNAVTPAEKQQWRMTILAKNEAGGVVAKLQII